MTLLLDDRLRDAHAHIDPGPPPQKTIERLNTAIACETPGRARRPRRHAAATRRRRYVVPAAGGVGIAVIVVVALLPGSGSVPGPSSAQAACVVPGPAGPCTTALRSAATAWRIPGDGQILYQRASWAVTEYTIVPQTGPETVPAAPNQIMLATATRPFTVARVGEEERWIAPDGSGRLAHSGAGQVTFPTTADRRAWDAAGRPDLQTLVPDQQTERPLATDLDPGRANEALLGANGLYDVLPPGKDPLAEIPQQAAPLTAWLQQSAWSRRGRDEAGCTASGAGCSPATRRLIDDTVNSDIETLLAYPATSPTLRASLIEVLTQRPGTRSLGTLHDAIGREVAAVALAPGMHDGDGANVVAFDPTSAELRAIGIATDGTVRWLHTYAIVSARVSAIGDQPPGDLQSHPRG